MTFYYVKFFTHKTHLFYGLLFTHIFVKVPIFTTFYTVVSPIRLYRENIKKTCLSKISTSCVYVNLYVYSYVYVYVWYL